VGNVAGEIELEAGVLVIRRIHARFTFRARAQEREAAEQAHRLHVDACPVYRSLRAAIAITSELAFEAG
jgi:uncharacterized OsmC-like protein